jgi:hypothetical protein
VKTENNLPAKDARKIETGFVGFFDILGYKSFLEAGIKEATFKVIDILEALPQMVKGAQMRHYGRGSDILKDLAWQVDRVVFLVVSDSILLRSAYDKSLDPSKQPAQAAKFLETALVLERVMFEGGLPLRGAIAFGDFIFHGNVFAGKPIIEAYELGQCLDLAVCVLHKTAEDELQKLVKSAPGSWDGILDEGIQNNSTHLVRYLVPIQKVETEPKQRLCLNLAWPRLLVGCKPLKERPDLRQYVLEQFWAHNKQVGPDEIRKVDNTERFFRFIQSRSPDLF